MSLIESAQATAVRKQCFWLARVRSALTYADGERRFGLEWFELRTRSRTRRGWILTPAETEEAKPARVWCAASDRAQRALHDSGERQRDAD
jgi:hypothetical protein